MSLKSTPKTMVVKIYSPLSNEPRDHFKVPEDLSKSAANSIHFRTILNDIISNVMLLVIIFLGKFI